MRLFLITGEKIATDPTTYYYKRIVSALAKFMVDQIFPWLTPNLHIPFQNETA
jgi:hypothetical protein